MSVRSGGHSWAAWSVHDDALMLDLKALSTIDYDEATGIASAGPATIGSLELAPYITERGRAFPGGHCATVGIGGYLLQGGQGWNGRAQGVGVRERRRRRRRHRSRASCCTATRDAERRPALGGARRRPGLPRCGRAVLPADVREARRHVAGHVDASTSTTPRRSCTGCTRFCPRLDRRVEPVMAATRLPDVPLHPGVEHPGGTVLLLHTTCMADSAEEAQRLIAEGLGDVPGARARARPRERARPRSPRRARPRSTRTPTATATPSTARGATRTPTCWRRCCSTSGARSTPRTRSRSGTAGTRCASCPTWRSRSRATSTSPPI